MDFEDVMAALIIECPFDTTGCSVECMPHDVDMKMEPLLGLEDEPHTVCRHVVVKTEPKLEHTWTLPPPPPSPSPSPPSTPRAAVPGVTTRSRTRSAISTHVATPLVASMKPRHVKTKAKARPTTPATKKLEAESSPRTKRASGKRKPKGMPPGPKPDLHIEPHDLFQYVMNAKLVRESIEEKYKITYYTVHRRLRKLLESLHLEDATVVHLKENGKLTFNKRRLKAEGVCSWERFCLMYM